MSSLLSQRWFFCSVSENADEFVSGRWLDDSAPVMDVVDEASRDSGICLMDATSGDDETYHDFSVLTD